MRIGIWELLLILGIVLVLFGGNRIRNLGSDLGAVIRGFRDAMKEGDKPETPAENPKKLEPSPLPQSPGDANFAAHNTQGKDRDKG